MSRRFVATLWAALGALSITLATQAAAAELEYTHSVQSISQVFPTYEKALNAVRASGPLHALLDESGEPTALGSTVLRTLRVPDVFRTQTGPAYFEFAGCSVGECLTEGQAIQSATDSFEEDGYCGTTFTPEEITDWDFASAGNNSVFYRKKFRIKAGQKSGSECIPDTYSALATMTRVVPMTACTGTFIAHAVGDSLSQQVCREQTLQDQARSTAVSCCAVEVDKKDTVGNPINVGSGAKRQTVTDYRSSTLEFTRHYNSLDQTRRVGLGAGWTHNWNRRLLLSSTDLPGLVAHEDGNMTRLTASGTDTWISIASDRPVKVVKAGLSYNLLRSDGYTDVYGGTTGRLNRVLDPSGRRVATLAYRHDGRLLSVTDGEGRVLSFGYNSAHQLARVVDPAGGSISFAFNADGYLTSVTQPDGATQTYHYEQSNAPGMLTGVTDADGVRVSTFAYDTKARANLTERAGGTNRYTLQYQTNGSTRVTDPSGAVETHAFVEVQGARRTSGVTGATTSGYASTVYNTRGFLTQATDQKGTVTTWTRDTIGRETSRTDAFGTPLARTTTTQWHATLNLPVRITEPGRETEYTYSTTGLLLTETVRDTASGVSRVTTHTYTPEGRRATTDGPRTDVADITHWDYDALGNLVRTTNALGQATVFTHDAHGNPLTITDPNGVVTTLTYDADQRLISRRVAGAETRYEYDADGQMTRTVQPDGSELRYTYDAAHRLTAVADALGNRIEYTLDTRGNRIEERTLDPLGVLTRQLRRTFDSKNLLATNIQAAGTTAYTYDAVGNRLTTTDALSRTTTTTYDALRRLSQTTDAAQGLTRYAYDVRGNLIQVTDPRGVITRYTYDGFDQVLSVESADAGTMTYAYDEAGNRIQQTDARGLQSHYNYDALNRLASVAHADSALNITYQWDSAAYGIGRLAAVTDGSGRTDYAYDARGNVIEERRSLASAILTTRYSHDLADRITAIDYPSGARAEFARDATGRVERVTLRSASGTSVVADGITYEPFGPLKGYLDGASREHARAYDLDGRITTIDTLGSQALDYGYDAAGNLTALTDLAAPAQSQVFGHDSLDRLVNAQGGYGAQSFAYDAVGNRRALNDGGAIEPYSYGSTSNRLLAVGDRPYVYDPAGNTLSDGRYDYTYDARNRLAEVSRDGTRLGRYAYNALGQRVIKVAGQRDTTDYAALAAAEQALADQQRALGDAHAVQAASFTTEAQAREADAVAASETRAAELVLAGQHLLAEQTLRAEAAEAHATAHLAADAEHAAGVAAQAAAAQAADAAVAATAQAVELAAQSAAATTAATGLETDAANLIAAATAARTDAVAQEAYAVDQRRVEAEWLEEAARQFALEAQLRAEAAALLAEAEPDLAKARMFRARIMEPAPTPAIATQNRNWVRQAEHFEAKVAHLTEPAADLLAQADAAHAVGLAAQAEAAAAAERSIQATLLAIALVEQAARDEALAAEHLVEAEALHLEATRLAAAAAAQEDLALAHRVEEGQFLAQAEARFATELAIRTAADSVLAAAHAEADALHAEALAAEARAAAAGNEATQALADAADLRAQALAAETAALAAHALASEHQVEADRLYALAQDPPNTEQTTLFAYDGAGHLLGEYDETGTLIREHLWLDDLPLASFTPDAVYLIQADHLHTPVSMTDLEGTVVWKATREAFGETEVTAAAGVTQNLRFPGQYFDAETGLHQNWNREYDPGLGRYTQSDPIGLEGGVNLFAYAMQDPLGKTDPSGLYFCNCKSEGWTHPLRLGKDSVGGSTIRCSYTCSCRCNYATMSTGKFKVLHTQPVAACAGRKIYPRTRDDLVYGNFIVDTDHPTDRYGYPNGLFDLVHAAAEEKCKECGK